MNQEYPPLGLTRPQIRDRSEARAQRPRVPGAILEQRAQIADRLRTQVQALSRRLSQLTQQQRKAFFVKIRHTGPIDLTGTGLKRLTSTDDRITFAVPKENDLNRLITKIDTFGQSPIVHEHVPDDLTFTKVEEFEPGRPIDRLSDDLLDHYDEMISRDHVIVEVEITSSETGRVRQRRDIQETLEKIHIALGRGVNGDIFEQEELSGVCRAVLWCKGSVLRELVEGRDWQTKITYFDTQPRFQT